MTATRTPVSWFLRSYDLIWWDKNVRTILWVHGTLSLEGERPWRHTGIRELRQKIANLFVYVAEEVDIWRRSTGTTVLHQVMQERRFQLITLSNYYQLPTHKSYTHHYKWFQQQTTEQACETSRPITSTRVTKQRISCSNTVLHKCSDST